METTAHRAQFQVKAQTGRRFTGLASTWDLDYGGDVIAKGAFSRSLKNWKAAGHTIPLIDQHNYGSVTSVVGKMIGAEETDDGLLSDFEIIGGAEGEPYRRRVEEGLIDGLSIGYEIIKSRAPTESERRLGVQRVLEDVELREVSLVIWGMNPDALITNVKQAIAHLPREEQRKLNTFIGNLQRKAPPADDAADAPAEEQEPPTPDATPEGSAESHDGTNAEADMEAKALLQRIQNIIGRTTP